MLYALYGDTTIYLYTQLTTMEPVSTVMCIEKPPLFIYNDRL